MDARTKIIKACRNSGFSYQEINSLLADLDRPSLRDKFAIAVFPSVALQINILEEPCKAIDKAYEIGELMLEHKINNNY